MSLRVGVPEVLCRQILGKFIVPNCVAGKDMIPYNREVR